MFVWMRVMVLRIRGCLTMRRMEEDFSRELEAHLVMLTEENVRRGMMPQDARRAAFIT